MSLDYQKTIDFLLENVNPSIKLRVKKEILGSITAEEEAELISQIKEEPIYIPRSPRMAMPLRSCTVYYRTASGSRSSRKFHR